MSGSGKIWRSSSAPKGNSTNPRPLMRAAASEIQKSARVAPLTCRYELAIFLHSFLNVDLFQQGDYAIRVTALLEGQQKLALPLRAIVSDELEQVDDSPDEELLPKISQDEGHYRCPRFFIRYKREEAAINQGALFRVEVPADRNIDAEPVLIRFELLYRKPAKGKEQINSPKLDDKRSQLDAVASHVFRLYLDTDAVSVSGRATFNEKHACALTWTAHAALLSFRHKTAPVLGKMDFKHYASQEGVVANGGGGGESTASNMSTASAATKLENNGSDVRSRRTASLWHSIIHGDSSDSSDDEGEVAEDGQSTSSAALAMAMADASFMPSTLKTARVNKSDKGAKNGTADDSSQRRKGQKYDLDVGDTWLKTMDVIHWACQSALHSSFSSIHKIIQKLARDLLDDFPEVDMESQINFTSLADATVAEVYSAIVRDVEGVSIAVCLMWEKYVMVLRKRSSQVLSQLEKADNLRRVMRVQCCLYTDSVESDDSAMPIDRDKPRSRNRRRLRQRTVDRLKILPVPRLEDASYPETRHTRPIFVRQTAEAKGRDEARRRADLLKLRSPIGPSHARHFDEDGRGRVNSRHVVGEGGEKIGGTEFTAEDFGMAEDDPTPIVHLDEKKMVVDAKGEPELRQKQKLAPLHLHRHSQAGTMAGSSSQSQNGGMVGGLHAVIFVHGFQGCSFDLRMLRNRLSTLLPMGEDEAERGETPFYFHLASSNEGDSHASIEKMGYKLANEVVYALKSERVRRLSFVAHSMGAVVVRAALSQSSMRPYLCRLHTFVSIAAPHLGYLYSTNTVFDYGMWFLRKWKRSSSLNQLRLTDSKDPSKCFLVQLSHREELKYFKHVVLLSSCQDGYVPFHSARIEVSPTSLKDSKMGAVHMEMTNALLRTLSQCTVTRYEVIFKLPKGTLNTAIGRSAHIHFLESQQFTRSFAEVLRLYLSPPSDDE